MRADLGVCDEPPWSRLVSRVLRAVHGACFDLRERRAQSGDESLVRLTVGELHDGDQRRSSPDAPQLMLRSVGIPLGKELSATIVVNCALRLLSASALTVCATYSPHPGILATNISAIVQLELQYLRVTNLRAVDVFLNTKPIGSGIRIHTATRFPKRDVVVITARMWGTSVAS